MRDFCAGLKKAAWDRRGAKAGIIDRHTATMQQVLRDFADGHFHFAARIGLVPDKLSTHKRASLYKAFPAAGSPNG